MLAEWAMTGEAPLDLWVVDIRRFSGLHADRQWVLERTCEAYGKHYTIGFPHEEYESGRPRIVSPLYERLKRQGAVRLEARVGAAQLVRSSRVEPRDIYAMGRQNWFPHVGEEHQHVREAAASSTSRALRSTSCQVLTRPMRWNGSALVTWRSLRAASPIRSCSTRAAASRPTSPLRGWRRSISTSSPAPVSAPMTLPGSAITCRRMRRSS